MLISMSAKKKTVQFHRTKTGFEEFDPENWCDLTLAEGYDKSVLPYNEDVDMIEPDGLVLGADCCVESSFDTTGDAGEVVWSRSSGVTIVKDGNQQSRQNTEQPAGGADPTTTNLKRKKKKNKGRRKKKQFRGQVQGRNSTQWKAGDDCMALYEDDGLYYRATITEVHENEGLVLVNYNDYNEDDAIAVKDIYPASLWENAGINVTQPTSSARSTTDNNFLKPTTKAKKTFKVVDNSDQRSSSNFHSFQNNLPGADFMATPGGEFTPPAFPFAPPTMQNGFIQSNLFENVAQSKEALSKMLTSWYMAGYHTGYYRGFTASPTASNLKNKPP
ncbi:unnamed protein product [Clavelina lepadiformis]|uniref:Tudor domain-containing protein n=1 Tax=Clavelina lepadiformis TaxID=159417 RepID=A0ABP0G2W2_CLALP